MERGKDAGLKKATGLCSRLYNFFARYFASQGTELVILGRVWRPSEGAPKCDFHPVATIPVGDAPAGSAGASAAWGGKVRIGRTVSIGTREEEGAAAPGRKKVVRPVKQNMKAPSNADERFDAFIRSRKEALRSESSLRRSPSRQ